MRIVGIDPSLTGTGIAWYAGVDGAGCCSLGERGITTLPLPARVAAIDGLISRILGTVGHADLYLIEAQITFATVRGASGAQLERSALWWLLYRRLIRAGCGVAVVAPSQLQKYATGKGGGSKTAVVDAVARRLPVFPTGGDNNMADAAVLCAMGADWLGQPIAPMPADHRQVLTKVNWPASVMVPDLS